VKENEAEVVEQFSKISRLLKNVRTEDIPVKELILEDFLWAWCCVNTRYTSILLELSSGPHVARHMTPKRLKQCFPTFLGLQFAWANS